MVLRDHDVDVVEWGGVVLALGGGGIDGGGGMFIVGGLR